MEEQTQPPPPPPHPPAGFVPHQGTNGLAIASLVLSLLWCYWVGSLLAVVLGHVALRQIKRSGGAMGGKGLAVAGVVLGWLGVAVGMAAAVLVAVFWEDLNDDPDRDEQGRIVNRGEISAFDVREGDCLNLPPSQEEIYSVEAVPCDQPHQAEVYAVFELGGEAYPGDGRVVRSAEAGCNQRFPGAIGRRHARSELEFHSMYPTRQSWRLHDDRGVTCWVTRPGDRLFTGSLPGSRA